MNDHLSEEQLALHYYDEGDNSPAVERHLAQCERCRSEFARLRALLVAVNDVDAAAVPLLSERYGAEVWERIHARLAATPGFGAPASRRQFRGLQQNAGGTPALQGRIWQTPRWAWTAAAAAVIVAAFFVGRWVERGNAPVTTATGGGITTTAADQRNATRDRILLVAVGDHLERSQMVLVELVNTRPGRTVDISAEQAAARHLLDDNRLYRQTAAQVRDVPVADLLDELERLLVDISHRPATVSEREFDDIRQRIEAQGILFKVRVLGSQVRQRERESASNSNPRKTT